MAAAENTLEIRVGHATPVTPAWRRKTPMQLPITLIPLAATEMYMVVLVFPKLR